MVNMFKPTANSKYSQFRVKNMPFSEQMVDVIIPFHGCYDKVAKLVQSLLYLTTTNQFRLCLVDDCSPNSTFIDTAFEVFPNVLTLRNESQIGFGASLQAGVDALKRYGEFPWLVFMHSDCVIEESNWLLSMGQTMLNLKESKVRMVSAMTNNSTGGSLLLQCEKENKRKTDAILEKEDYLPLYCSLCHKDLFNKINGFIKHYPYVGYEDRELAYRMRKYGYRQAVCGNAWVYHEGGATTSYLRRKKQIVIDNKKIWLEDMKNLCS